jgi:hypothetical protein
VNAVASHGVCGGGAVASRARDLSNIPDRLSTDVAASDPGDPDLLVVGTLALDKPEVGRLEAGRLAKDMFAAVAAVAESMRRRCTVEDSVEDIARSWVVVDRTGMAAWKAMRSIAAGMKMEWIAVVEEMVTAFPADTAAAVLEERGYQESMEAGPRCI